MQAAWISPGCGILSFLTRDQNPHPLHWKTDSLPLDHQEVPNVVMTFKFVLNVAGYPGALLSLLPFTFILSILAPEGCEACKSQDRSHQYEVNHAYVSADVRCAL